MRAIVTVLILLVVSCPQIGGYKESRIENNLITKEV
jgi:hypothetical protein